MLDFIYSINACGNSAFGEEADFSANSRFRTKVNKKQKHKDYVAWS